MECNWAVSTRSCVLCCNWTSFPSSLHSASTLPFQSQAQYSAHFSLQKNWFLILAEDVKSFTIRKPTAPPISISNSTGRIANVLSLNTGSGSLIPQSSSTCWLRMLLVIWSSQFYSLPSWIAAVAASRAESCRAEENCVVLTIQKYCQAFCESLLF